jgi:RND family efflux transporter MFP subunit
MKFPASLGRVAVTLAIVAVAAVVGWQLWVYYMEDPWTRDGRVRADVVGIAPDVSGFVSEVMVQDNETVQAGHVLFRLDRARYDLALAQAKQQVLSRRATWEQAKRDLDRYNALDATSVSKQRQEQARQAEAEAAAAFHEAEIQQNVAQLNVDRTDITAPVSGVITNFHLQPGDYLAVGKAVTALVDTQSFYVVGYFEETKLLRIKVGDRARVHLMGESGTIEGHVQSIAAGIEDRELGSSINLLANPNPTFSWVRLAQRVPVRVAIDKLPEGMRRFSGRTARVTIVE